MSVYYQSSRNLDFIIASSNAIIALQKTTLKYVFGQAKKPIDICTKIVHMDTKIFNIIPGSGEVTILLYGDIGDGGKVESGRVVGELLALQRTYNASKVLFSSSQRGRLWGAGLPGCATFGFTLLTMLPDFR